MPLSTEYTDYPPRHRIAPPLELPRIEVTDANGTILTTPNALFGCVLWGVNGEQPRTTDGHPIDEIGKDAKIFNPLELLPRPDVPSILSGEPSVAYFADDVLVNLTPAELLRLIARELTPQEHGVLLRHFGMFWEIDGHYYDPESGLSYRVLERQASETPGVEPRRFGG